MIYDEDFARSTISNGYLQPDFISAVHKKHPYALYGQYGGFVITDFLIGSKATALYCGEHIEEADTIKQAEDMYNLIGATFKIGSTTAGPSYSLSGETAVTTSYYKKFNSVKMAVKTLGGSSPHVDFKSSDLADANFDLTSWYNTIDSPDKISLMGFRSGGLVPLSDFILEKNIKEDINSYIAGNTVSSTAETEPELIVGVVSYRMPTLVLRVGLKTRKGDWIFFDQKVFYANTANVDELIKAWAEPYTGMFGIKMVYNTPWTRSVEEKKVKTSITDYVNYLTHMSNYKKLVNDGILYIIDEEDKVGFSIPNEDKYINQYALRDYLNTIGEASVKYTDLWESKYVINAL